MAYVAISKNVIEQVTNVISNLRHAEINSLNLPAVQQEVTTDPAVREALDAALWGAYADLKPRLGHLSSETRVDVVVPLEHNGATKRTELQFQGIKVPCICKVGYSYFQFNEVAPALLQLEKVQQWNDLRIAHYDVEARWEKVKADITKFLNSCKSLNEAIKLYPDVARYVPPNLVEKVNERTKVQSKKESDALAVLRSIDLDNIQASTVLARMAGAKA